MNTVEAASVQEPSAGAKGLSMARTTKNYHGLFYPGLPVGANSKEFSNSPNPPVQQHPGGQL